MEIANFEMDTDRLPIKDATARQAAADVLVVAERAEGKADNAQTVADRSEGKADNAQAVADRAEGKADDALSGLAGLTEKQDNLNHPSFTGNIDELVNDNSANGYRFVNASLASGTQPKSSGFYMLLVFGGLQIAVDVNATTIYLYARTYINSEWSYWRKVQLTK